MGSRRQPHHVLQRTETRLAQARFATVTGAKLSEDEWRKKLSVEEYHVLREKGTERPYTGAFDDFYPEEGHFTCAGTQCKVPFFIVIPEWLNRIGCRLR